MDFYFFLDSRFRGNDTKEAPSLGLAFGPAGLSTARGEGKTSPFHSAKMLPFFFG
jgi:hypothetical protein